MKTPGIYTEFQGWEWESGKNPYPPASYWKDPNGEWHCVTPNGLWGWLKNHHVEEHTDKTISVLSGPYGSNSILVSNGSANKSWHGYINHGTWEEC
jgi:hypothetical protein